ncbi:AAA family ATPase [bacterium]|nr:AAA family ATPase [bacterium]
MGPHTPEMLPVVRAAELAADPPEQRWLIEPLWAASGVGVVGGLPKVGKSWLGLEMAVSVASGTPCLGAYPTAERGPVLLYMAEDADVVVRERLEALCRHRGVDLASLDLFVITVDRLRIDLPAEQERLRKTVDRIRPRMLLLDPLVRLHSIDENHAGDVSALLAYLRGLQRQLDTAIVLVHHARKSGANGQPGQALRGSGDIHAWGDSNLYLRRKDQQLVMTIEHRAAPSPEPVTLQLQGTDTPHLAVVCGADVAQARTADLDQAVIDLLDSVPGPMTRTAIREKLRARNDRIGRALSALADRGAIQRSTRGWTVAASNRSRSRTMRSVGPERSSNSR